MAIARIQSQKTNNFYYSDKRVKPFCVIHSANPGPANTALTINIKLNLNGVNDGKKSCFMFSVILFPIYVGATSFTSNVTGGTVTSNLSMTVKASCSTTVGDVTFGDQSAG